jgi:DNA-binding GntR family transcriptional regulator
MLPPTGSRIGVNPRGKARFAAYSVYRVPHTLNVTAALARLEAAPDLVERVYRSLADAVSAGTLAPGTRLRQEDLARQLAVSRQPVLQALRLLKADGLVVDAPGRGLCVAPLDADWLVAVYQVRAALDVLAARLGAAHRAVIDPALIAHGRRVALRGDVPAMIDADIAFHRAVYAASRNPLIEQAAQVHWRHIRRAMGAALQRAAVRDTVWDEHEAIAEAIARGDADAAAERISGHASRASDHLRRLLAAANPEGDDDEAHRRAARDVRA